MQLARVTTGGGRAGRRKQLQALLGQGELALLRSLSRRGAFVCRRDGEWQIVAPRRGMERPGGRMLPAELEAYAQSGLLRADGDRFVISAARLAALRRHLTRPAAVVTAARPNANSAHATPAHRRAGEDALEWLRRHKGPDGRPLIGVAEFDAGERLRAEFQFAQLTPRITSSWSQTATLGRTQRAAPGAGVELRDGVEAARTRVRRALVAAGPDLAGVLVDVCCHFRSMRDIERHGRLPQRSGKLLLKMALTALARHYGLLPPDDGAWIGRIGIRHWGTADFRPSLEKWK